MWPDIVRLAILLIFSAFSISLSAAYEVVWAVNCGGEAHTDIYGFRYQKDTLSTGIASDHGKSLIIQRVAPQDQVLYQTERYNYDTFGYDIPLNGDGNYVLILKFSEVWFAAPNQKVFDVTLNAEHVIVSGLDIFGNVGRGVAHDEVVPFKIKNSRLFVGSEVSDLYQQKMPVQFVKLDRDNPKINAIVLIKGNIDEVPKLPPLAHTQQQEPPAHFAGSDSHLHEKEREEDEASRKKRKVSGPKAVDPYSSDPSSWALLPVLIAVAAALPIMFCLCKL